jgi:hypothetical protein
VKPHPKGSTKFPVHVLDAVYDRCELWLRSVCSEGAGWAYGCIWTGEPACEDGPSCYGGCSTRVTP